MANEVGTVLVFLFLVGGGERRTIICSIYSLFSLSVSYMFLLLVGEGVGSPRSESVSTRFCTSEVPGVGVLYIKLSTAVWCVCVCVYVCVCDAVMPLSTTVSAQ